MKILKVSFITIVFIAMSITIYILYGMNITKQEKVDAMSNDLSKSIQLLQECEKNGEFTNR